MRIRSFHMDGFGIFSDVNVPNLSPGLSIFLGNNEAGKSTCLDFFRTMLTGYPDHRSKELSHPPLRGGQAGGSLTLDTLQHGLVRLTRRPGSGRGLLSLHDADGAVLDSSVLDHILSGVTREVYRTVFGFSLSELQTFDSLNAEGVRHALYGASFGMGLRSPNQLFKLLDERMDNLFKPGGSKPAMNAALRQWDELNKAVSAAEQECARFDALSLEKTQQEQACQECRAEKLALEQERRQLERRLGVWRQWDEWRNLKARLDRLEAVAPGFPEDGPARLTRATEQHEAAARHLSLMQERLRRTQESLDKAQVNNALLATLPPLQSLAERKSSYRQARISLPAQQAAFKRAQADLQRLLDGLGPDWTCERIRTTNRSLFAREELERQADEMNTALSVHTAAVDALEKGNRAVEKSEHELEREKTVLQHLPMPVSSLDDAGRECLHRTLHRIEEVRSRLPERQRALREAQSTFARTYEPLRMPSGNPGELLQTLADSQARALELGQAVQEHMHTAQAANLSAVNTQEAEDRLKSRIDRLRAQHLANRGPSRATLDARTAAVRSLRHSSAALSVEQDRLRELEERKNSMIMPAPLKSWWLMSIGLVLMLSGLAMLLASWKWGVTTIAITPQLSLPLSLWSGYLVVLTGVGFLAGGLPRSGPEAKRHLVEMEQLASRVKAAQQRILDLENQIASLCASAGTDSADPITLDATEMLLERERELCVTEERLSQDMTDLQAEYSQAKEKNRQAVSQQQQAEGRVQQARRRWHEFLLGCHVTSVPAPEACGVFFGRVEAARVAHAAVCAVEAECRHLEDTLVEQQGIALSLPPVAERFQGILPSLAAAEEADTADANQPDHALRPSEKDKDLEALLAALHSVTEACREADAAAEARLKAGAAVDNAEANLERAFAEQHECAASLKAADARLDAARAAWRGNMQSLGLGLDLSPPTVREALEGMERCLGAEAELARLYDDIKRLEREEEALVRPLQELLQRLERECPCDSEGIPQWISCLDSLLADALAMEKLAAEVLNWQAAREEQQDLVRSAEAALSDAQQAQASLLEQAAVTNAEEFLRHARIKEERENCLRRQQDLEDALTFAAAPLPLADFLDSFADFDKAEREVHALQLAANIEALESRERESASSIASLSALLGNLSSADHLSRLRQQQADLAESLRSMAHEWSRHALARRLLEEAKRRFEQERQPQVIRSASEIFAAITQGAWVKIAASLEDSSLTVLPPQEQQEKGMAPVSPSLLSRGTQEQLYLALRLAYIRNHAAHAAPLPVIMDDILVNFDPIRAEQTAHALLALSQGGGAAHQILFFTCHPHMAKMLQGIMPEASLFAVEKGHIRAA